MTGRSKDVGNPMLVNLPQIGYEDSGEGGLAFFFVVKQKPCGSERQVCFGGYVMWPLQDCQIKPRNWPPFLDRKRSYTDFPLQPIDAGVLVGSTGLSLWSDNKEEYFTPNVTDLTPEGKRLYHTLKKIYGEVTIVTLLDT